MRGTISNPDKPGQTPLFLAVALHLGVFLLALASPHLVPKNIHPPEIYQVELYTTVEPTPPPALPHPPAPVVETPAKVAAVAISPPPHPLHPLAKPTPHQQVKPLANPQSKPEGVSLAPLKERLLKEAREREEKASEEHKLAEQMDLLKLDLKKQRAEEQSREATQKAREAIAALYRTTQARPTAAQDNINPKPRTEESDNGANIAPAAGHSGPAEKEIMAAYKARLNAQISAHWVLPEHQDWDKNLTTTIVIRIRKDGTVTSTWFEKNSGNTRFDQYVKKAIDRSSPLPALPTELGKNSEEIGVTFTPGGLK